VKLSTERILTTHTGSLPRPAELTAALERRDRGELAAAELDGRIREAVVDVVRRQAAAGVNVVNDGEASKIGYSTYVKERLGGFGGQSGPAPRHPTPRSSPSTTSARWAGSDCGFATFATRPTVDPAVTWAKLRAMADGARLASERLWPSTSR
jgi:methionine synthase II (cobalamin-independent)